LALQEVKKLEEASKKETQKLQSKISELIAQAQSLLESAKYQQAADLANNILNLDADNPQAKLILDTAMAKSKEVAQEQAVNTITKDPANALEGLTSGFDN